MRRSLVCASGALLFAATLAACGSETTPTALDDVPELRAVELARFPETPTDVTVVGEHLLVAMSRTRLDGAIVVELAEVDADGRLAVADRPPVLEIPHPASFHNGGALVAHHGDLVVSIGDDDDRGGEPGSLRARPPLGSIVRVPADQLDPRLTDGPYEPSGRDFVASGLRHPWRMALDRETDSLWIADVGEASMEEVDVLPLDGRHMDFGWPAFEGTKVFRKGPSPADLKPPVFTREHGDGVCAIIGGFVYRDGPVDALKGAYVYGDFCSTEIRAVQIEDGEVVEDRPIIEVAEPPVAIAEGPGGRVFVLGAYGGIFGIEAGSHAAVPPAEVDEELACRVQESFRALETAASMDPTSLARGVEAARDAAADVLETDAPELRRAATEVLKGYERALREGTALGWDPAAVVSTVLPELTSGEGEHAYFELALTELLERLAAPC